MSAGRPAEHEGSVTLTPETLDVTEWLQDCFEKLESGREHEIISDPFYTPKGGPMSDDRVDALITALDARLDIEIDNYPSYHERRSGANAKTEFHRLGPSARRAMAEGLMRIIEEHDDYEKEQARARVAASQSEPGPAYSG